MNSKICLMLIFAQSNLITSKLKTAPEVIHTEVSPKEVTKSYLVLKEALDAGFVNKLKHSTKSYEQLRNILLSDARNTDNICSRDEKNIFKSDFIYKSRRKFWDILKEHKTWSVALVDYDPFRDRVAGVEAMLRRSEVVILHDSEESRYHDVPTDFSWNETFSHWNGHKVFTDCSEPVKYLSLNDGTTKTRIICTSAIQGTRDTGLFARLVGNFMERFSDLNSCYYHHNRGNEPYCTHLRLLIPAALLSKDDIIELGSGLCSTELLHQITVDKVKVGDKVRLFTVDTDKAWLDTWLPLQNKLHSLILVAKDWTLRPHLQWRDEISSIYAH